MNIPPNVRSWAEIDLDAIRHNLRTAREKSRAGVIAIVKADAYGHGAARVAQAIASEVELFGVANLAEARALESLGRDLLLLSPALAGERAEIVARRAIATVSSAAEAAAFAGGRVNFKVDTGMGRIGCWQDDAVAELRAIAGLDGVHLHSISTHLPVADEDEAWTRTQLEHFAELVKTFRTIAPNAKIHALNSAGILGFPEHAHDLVRPGLMLYGSASPKKYQTELRPALAWKCRILLVRDMAPGRTVSYGRTFRVARPMRVAALPAGYADGFPRQARGAEVLVGGRRCAVLGRVTMDQILIDVTDVPDARPDDEAVLIGRQGHEEITAAELAERAGTIAWDVFTGLGPRVRRIFQ